MADTGAERSRRARKHKAGDHAGCDPKRCREARADVELAPVPSSSGVRPVMALPSLPDDDQGDDAPQRGGIELSVEAYVTALGFAEGDPRAILGEIAVRLAKRVDESGALPAAVRELRVLLAQISEDPAGPAGKVDEVRLQRAHRRLDQLIASAA
jgi:hypothetical protein